MAEKWEVRSPLRWGSKLERSFDNETDARNFADQLLLSMNLATVEQIGCTLYVLDDDDE